MNVKNDSSRNYLSRQFALWGLRTNALSGRSLEDGREGGRACGSPGAGYRHEICFSGRGLQQTPSLGLESCNRAGILGEQLQPGSCVLEASSLSDTVGLGMVRLGVVEAQWR